MLALPAEAGSLGQRLFHDRCRVDENLDVGTAFRSQLAGDLLQPALDHIVIVAVACVDRNRCAVGLFERFQRILGRAVIHGEHDDGSCFRPKHPWVATASKRLGHPIHCAVLSLGDERRQPAGGLRNGIGRRHRDRVEPQPPCFAVDESAKVLGGPLHLAVQRTRRLFASDQKSRSI
jgi:hypothetical protein